MQEQKQALVSEIMHRHVVTADCSTSARKCAELIAAERIGCLIIVKNGKPVGIVTERSFVHLLKRGDIKPDRIKAEDFMSSPLIAISESALFSDAISVFNSKGIKRLPVLRRGKVIGLISLKDMIEFSNLALSNLEKKHHRLEKTASFDELTGIYNKAAMQKFLVNEYERIERYGGRSSILFIDIDHFKNVNDTYSHLAGDAVLKEIGTILKSECRHIDTVGRFGGEEFLVVAPNRKKYHAVMFGERLRKTIEKHIFKYNKTIIRCTVSIGIASLFEGRGYNHALERADKALYHAKNMGRNRIGLWRDGKLVVANESQ
jgi:diguanylate cyclase (GGDEF)-like protein